MRRSFNVKRARAYYAHQGLVERQPLITHGRNEPTLLFAPKVTDSHKKNKKLPLPTPEINNAALSMWGNGGLMKRFIAQRSVNLGSD